jgi:germination protein M
MRPRLALLVALPLVTAACGSSNQAAAPVTTTTPGTTTVAPAARSVVVYFLHDGKVAPVRVPAGDTRAVATAALGALLEGPPEGYDTAIPSGGQLVSLAIEGGVATATLSDRLRSLDPAGAAQLVYTLTQFPSVTGVQVLPRPLNDEHGQPLGEPATRADFEAETPAILIESPLPGDAISSPVRVTGTANTFEATFQLALRQGGAELAKETVTATSGSGERGTFDVQVSFEGSGDATLVAWEDNAGYPEGGTEAALHKVELPVSLG